MAYSKGMAPGLPARVAIVCAVVVTAAVSHAQPPPIVPPDRPPVTSPTAPAPTATPGPQPTTAQASDRRFVAVIDLSTDKGAEELADALYNVLVNHPDLRPLVSPNLVKALKGPFLDEETSYIDTAKAAKKEADELLVLLDWRSAEVAADRGMTALLNVRPTSDVLGLYAELAFASGFAALRQRKPNDASLAFGLSYRLDPAKRPDPGRYEPDIVDAYQLAVTKIPVQAKLEVKGAGTVWIDGIDRGGPGVHDVAQGLHLVQLSGFDRDTRGRQINVPQTSALELEAAPVSNERKIERARLELAQTRDDAARAGAVKKLAQLLGVGDAVLIEKGEGGKLRVQTWRDRAPGFSNWVVHDNEPAGDLLVPLAPPRKVVAIPPEERDTKLPPLPEKTPFYRTRWFYGSVAVALVVGAVYGYVRLTEPGMIGVNGDIKPEGE